MGVYNSQDGLVLEVSNQVGLEQEDNYHLSKEDGQVQVSHNLDGQVLEDNNHPNRVGQVQEDNNLDGLEQVVSNHLHKTRDPHQASPDQIQMPQYQQQKSQPHLKDPQDLVLPIQRHVELANISPSDITVRVLLLRSKRDWNMIINILSKLSMVGLLTRVSGHGLLPFFKMEDSFVEAHLFPRSTF